MFEKHLNTSIFNCEELEMKISTQIVVLTAIFFVVTFPETKAIKSLGLLGRRQANLCFHFAGSGENLPNIAKSRDASMGRKGTASSLKPQVAIFQLRSSHKLHKGFHMI